MYSIQNKERTARASSSKTMAASQKQQQVKVLEDCRIAPPPGYVPPSSLPLTFFDVYMSICPLFRRIFFYELPCSRSAFLNTHLPNLKHSLSLALQIFYPLAGRLVPGQDGGVPVVSYSDGDFVILTVAECDDDIHYLAANQPREETRFFSLVPDLSISATTQPVLSLQATLFPDHGIGIGLCGYHAVSDGSTTAHFMKTWACICRHMEVGRGDCDVMGAIGELPFYDRSAIRDQRGLELEKMLLAQVEKSNGWTLLEPMDFTTEHVPTSLATFVLSRAQLDELVRWVFVKTSTNCSTFALTCAVVWTCLLKAKFGATTAVADDDETIEWFAFLSDFRSREGCQPPIPKAYFGNCLGLCIVKAKRCDLIRKGECGLAMAAVAIWNEIKGMKKGGIEAESWIPATLEAIYAGGMSVAGSPKLGVYDVDFGWGKPKKTEVVSILKSSAISLAENNDEGEGGVEIGVALPSDVMDKFASLFAASLKTCFC